MALGKAIIILVSDHRADTLSHLQSALSKWVIKLVVNQLSKQTPYWNITHIQKNAQIVHRQLGEFLQSQQTQGIYCLDAEISLSVLS
jgi:hypothetical protein